MKSIVCSSVETVKILSMVEKTVPLKVIIQMEDITDADKELASNAVLIFLLLNLRVLNCIL